MRRLRVLACALLASPTGAGAQESIPFFPGTTNNIVENGDAEIDPARCPAIDPLPCWRNQYVEEPDNRFPFTSEWIADDEFYGNGQIPNVSAFEADIRSRLGTRIIAGNYGLFNNIAGPASFSVRQTNRFPDSWAPQIESGGVRTLTGRAQTVTLKGLPKGRYVVRARITLTDGRVTDDTRRYRTCTPKKKRR